MKQFFLILTAFVLFAAPGHAAGSAPSPVDGALAARVENYLNSVTTLKARFLQTNPDGSQATGTFYLNRPGKLRFEYDPPIKDFVVADGYLVYFFDGAAGQPTSAPIGNTLADFFLRKNIRLSGDLTVGATQHAAALWQVTMTQTDDPLSGSLMVGVGDDGEGRAPVLRKWRIIDGQGQITEVELFDAVAGPVLPNSLFVFKDPRPGVGLNR